MKIFVKVGLLVATEQNVDSKDLANGIKWLTNNNSIKNDLVSKAIKRIVNDFNSEKLIQGNVNLYEKLI